MQEQNKEIAKNILDELAVLPYLEDLEGLQTVFNSVKTALNGYCKPKCYTALDVAFNEAVSLINANTGDITKRLYKVGICMELALSDIGG